MNEQNLQQNQANRTPEQRREAASKAGKASGKARRERKVMKQELEMLLSGQAPLIALEELARYEIPGIRKSSTVQLAMLARTAVIAMGLDENAKPGDIIRAMETLRDTVGDKNPEKLELANGNALPVNITVVE